MGVRVSSAFKNKSDQVSEIDGYVTSLHAMWRAVGSPEGKSPEDWIRVAQPLLDALSAYEQAVYGKEPGWPESIWGGEVFPFQVDGGVRDVPGVGEVDFSPQPDDLVQNGDLTTSPGTAEFYARFLDREDIELRGRASIWNKDGDRFYEPVKDDRGNTVCFGPDGERVATFDKDGNWVAGP